LAVELEAYNRAERKSYARSTTTESSSETNALKALSAKFDSLQNEVRDLKFKVKIESRRSRSREHAIIAISQATCRDLVFARKAESQNNRKQTNAGAKKQIRAKAAKHLSNEKQNAKQPAQGQVSSIGANTAGAEAGMFLKVMICGVKAKF
jgi:septal ring factor EnvC (AmiA/AmiB activator)